MAHESAILKTAEADYDAVMKQMVALRDDMAKLALSVQTVASARGTAIAHDMTQGMTDAASYISRKGHDADDRIEGAVAANPYIALGLAAGVGLLFGAMTRR
jgi:ElaB/YqjD/DUF883 family membrane-anchored ribosome-binding protein